MTRLDGVAYSDQVVEWLERNAAVLARR
jgi:hypothetical protein